MLNSFNIVTDKTKTILQDSQDKKTTRKYDKIPRDFSLIIRANDRSKCISAKVEKLASRFIFRLKKHEMLIMSHAQISKITGCKSRQNANLLKYLADIFHIKYHKAKTVDGKKYRNVFIIEYTKDGREILEDPAAYYNKMSLLYYFILCYNFAPPKEEEEPVKINKPEGKILPENTQKITGSIYKEINNEVNKIDIDRKAIESTTNCHRLEENLSNFNSFEKKGKFAEAIQQKGTLQLKDFSLIDEDYEKLRQSSGRNFSNSEIYTIKHKLSEKLKDRLFECKALFMEYMRKALKGEMRQEGSFKTIEEKTTEEEKSNFKTPSGNQETAGKLFELVKSELIESTHTYREHLKDALIRVDVEENIQQRTVTISRNPNIPNFYYYDLIYNKAPDLQDICERENFTLEVIDRDKKHVITPETKQKELTVIQEYEEEKKQNEPVTICHRPKPEAEKTEIDLICESMPKNSSQGFKSIHSILKGCGLPETII